MKIAILTCSTKNRKWLYDITNPTKIKYCNKYNYEYIFSDEFYPDKTRHPYWNKIKFVADNLKNYDYIIWMDDDAGFIRFDKTLDELFNCNFGYCEDLNGLNCGIFIVKNTNENQKIFDFIWNNLYNKFKNNKFPEQDALSMIYQKDLKEFSTKFNGELYNAYDLSIIYSPKNQKTNNTIILHIAAGSEYKENHKKEIKEFYEFNL